MKTEAPRSRQVDKGKSIEQADGNYAPADDFAECVAEERSKRAAPVGKHKENKNGDQKHNQAAKPSEPANALRKKPRVHLFRL